MKITVDVAEENVKFLHQLIEQLELDKPRPSQEELDRIEQSHIDEILRRREDPVLSEVRP